MYLIKHIFIFAFIASVAAVNQAYGQRIINVGIHVAPCLSSIHTTFPSSVKDAKSEGGFNINFKISGKYFLTDQMGVNSGFEVLSFDQTSSTSSTYECFNVNYSDNLFYERRVWGDSINENVTVKILHIPLQIFYQHKFNNAVAVFCSVGPGISVPVAGKTAASGTFTYKGYFPDEKALLWDIPVYGLSSGVDINLTNKPELNHLIINVAASMGIELSINRYYRFNAAIGYYRTLTNAFKSGNSVHISDQIGSYNSVLGSGKNFLSNAWFSLGFSKNILF